MTHSHDHEHSHGHGGADAGEMSFREKLEKLLAHWIKHNKDHADTYRQWAERSRSEDLGAVAEMLDSAAEANNEINTRLERALALIEAENQ